MNFETFDNSIFPVLICEDGKVVYRNNQAKRVFRGLRCGDSAEKRLLGGGVFSAINGNEAIPAAAMFGDGTPCRLFAFTCSLDREYEVFVCVRRTVIYENEEINARLARALPLLFAREINGRPDRTIAGRACEELNDPELFAGLPPRGDNRETDFNAGNTVDLNRLLTAASRKILRRIHVLGLKTSFQAEGESFRCRIDTDGYIYFFLVMTFLTAAFPDACVRLTGGDLVSVSFGCAAGDGTKRQLSAREFFSMLGVGGFTADVLLLCMDYFDMLICETDGRNVTARLVLPASLSILFSVESTLIDRTVASLIRLLAYL